MCSLKYAYSTFQCTYANANFLEGFKFSTVYHQLISSTLKVLYFKPQNTLHHQFNIKKASISSSSYFLFFVQFLTINTNYVPKHY